MRTIITLIFTLFIVAYCNAGGSQLVPNAYSAMVNRLHSASTYQANVDITVSSQNGTGQTGEVKKMTFTERIVYKKPNRLVISIPEMGGITIWSDGKSLYQYYGMVNQYKQSGVPSDMIGIITSAPTIDGWKSLGNDTIAGVPVSVINGNGLLPGSQSTMWIGVADHLPYKIVTVQPKSSSSTYTTILTQQFRDSLVNQPIPDKIFQLHTPKNATKSAPNVEVPDGIGLAIPGGAK